MTRLIPFTSLEKIIVYVNPNNVACCQRDTQNAKHTYIMLSGVPDDCKDILVSEHIDDVVRRLTETTVQMVQIIGETV